MVPALRTRDDVEGCACLDCRPVDAVAVRRTVLDALGWSVRLCLARPSIPLLAVAVFATGRLLTGTISGPEPAAELAGAAQTFGSLVLLRAYVATVAAGAVTGAPASSRTALARVLRRLPHLLGLVAVGGALLVVAWLVSSSALSALFILAAFLATRVELIAEFGPAVLALPLVATLVLPLLVVLFKCWFAVEACVLGRYGPVESLRVSWRLTTNYRWKLAATLLPVLGAVALPAAGGLAPSGLPAPSLGVPLDPLAAAVGELTAVVWYGVYAHLYVQGAVDA